MLAPRRSLVRRPGDPLQRPGRMPRHRRARVGLEHAAREPSADAPPGSARRGLGVALSAHISGLLASGAIVRLLEDGSVAAQHRRGRHRPGLEHGADADLRRGAEGSGRARGDRQPRHRRLALQLGHDREPRHLRRPAARWSARRRGRAAAEGARRRDARMRGRRPRAAPGGEVGIKGVPQKRGELRRHLGRAPTGRAGGPIIGTHSWVFDQKTFDPKRAVAIGLPFAQIGVFSFNALVVEVEVDEATGQVERAARLVGLRRRPRDQPGDGRTARSKARSCRAWATR